LALGERGPYIEPDEREHLEASLPAQPIYECFHQSGFGCAGDSKIREFLRYILSRDGQEGVVREGSYLPLTVDVIREELRKLE
jgi:phosphate transport system substrate-binding protein